MKANVAGLAFVVLLLSSPFAWAESPMALGHGTISCGAWINDKSTVEVYVEKSWVLGYITGVNVWAGLEDDFSKGIDAQGLFSAIDIYCRGHPLDTLADAVDKLIYTLLARNMGNTIKDLEEMIRRGKGNR